MADTTAKPSGNQPGAPLDVNKGRVPVRESGSALPPSRSNNPVPTTPKTKTTTIDPRKVK